MKVKSYIEDLIHGRRQGFLASILRLILGFLSFFYGTFIKLRNFAYDLKIFSPYSPQVPLVISIGNITAGGTGKTPAVLFTAKEFYGEFKIAVLSRGYLSFAEKEAFPTVLSRGDGKGPLYPASQAGDEPVLIAENLPKAIVAVGKNRCEASKITVAMGAELILLDDGLQHRKLARDLDIVLVDSQDPFGNGSFLPRGFLRDEIKSLSRADLIILNHVESEGQFLSVKSQMEKYSKAKVIGVTTRVSKVFDLSRTELFCLDEKKLEGKKVAIFCALAKPEKFKKTVLNEGAEILAEYFISDHLPFDPIDLENFANVCRAKGVEMLVCTEKDQVKLPKYLKVSLSVVWIKVEIYPVYGNNDWTTFIKNAKKTISRRL